MLSIFLVIFVIVASVVAHRLYKTDVHASSQKNEEVVVMNDTPNMYEPVIDIARDRDMRVLGDPLYPPLNRTDAATFDTMVDQISRRNFYVPTSDYNDSYRMVGYLTNSGQVFGETDTGGGTWKLMARQVNNNQSDFYLIPSNNNYSMKIPLNGDIVKGRRLKDVYDIPNEMYFDTPLLSKGPYIFTEIPKTDFVNTAWV